MAVEKSVNFVKSGGAAATFKKRKILVGKVNVGLSFLKMCKVLMLCVYHICDVMSDRNIEKSLHNYIFKGYSVSR